MSSYIPHKRAADIVDLMKKHGCKELGEGTLLSTDEGVVFIGRHSVYAVSYTHLTLPTKA